MTHFTSARFWACYNSLVPELRETADKQYALLKQNAAHPSLHFKKVGKFWSVRVNERIRALAVADGEDFIWFWIGDHKEYDRLIAAGK